MSDFFDTSVLLAAFHADDPRHEASIRAIAAAESGLCAAHSLAELYATLTQLPIATLPPPEVVVLYIESLLEKLSAVTLTETELTEAVQHAAAARSMGARMYDELLLRTAEKAGANRFFTWNTRDFATLTAPASLDILTPNHAA